MSVWLQGVFALLLDASDRAIGSSEVPGRSTRSARAALGIPSALGTRRCPGGFLCWERRVLAMSPGEVLLAILFGVAVAAAAGAWALFFLARGSRAPSWDAYADAHGWGHTGRRAASMPDMALPPAYEDADHRVSVPLSVGPARMFVRRDVGTLVWVGMPLSSEGIRLRPHGRFVRHRDVAKASGLPAACATLLSEYDLEGDRDVLAKRLTGRVAQILLRPGRAITMRWKGDDLWLEFPVAPSRPEDAAVLLRYSEAVAAGFVAADAAARPRPVPLSTGLPDTMRVLGSTSRGA